MNVGVIELVVVDKGVDDGARLLRGGGVVEVNERLAMDLLIQNRKVLPQRRPIDSFIHGNFLAKRFSPIKQSSNPEKHIRNGRSVLAIGISTAPIWAQSSPSCNLAASVIMPWFQGGSQTSSTLASSIGSMEMSLFCTSWASTGPMPQPGAVRVIFTSAL